MLSANKAKQSADLCLLSLDVCRYQYQCFVTLVQANVMSGHQVKKDQTMSRDNKKVRNTYSRCKTGF